MKRLLLLIVVHATALPFAIAQLPASQEEDRILAAKADSLQRAGDPKSAAALLDTLYDRGLMRSDTAVIVSALMLQGQLLTEIRQHDKAIMAYENAWSLLPALQDTLLHLTLLDNLIESSKNHGDFSKALHYTETLYELTDSVRAAEHQAMMEAAGEIYNGTIASMSKWQDRQNQATNRRILLLTIAAGTAGAAVVMLLVALLIKSRKARPLHSDKSSTQQIASGAAAELQELRIAHQRASRELDALAGIEQRSQQESRMLRMEIEDATLPVLQAARTEVEELIRTAPGDVRVDAVLNLRNTLVRLNTILKSIALRIAADDSSTGKLDRQLREICESMSTAELPVNFYVSGNTRQTSASMNQALRQMTLELLRNAFRHARATRIQVDLIYSPGKVVVAVRDNGTGMTREQAAGGPGVAAIRLYAQRINAHVDVATAPHEGTTITMDVPDRTN